MAAIAIIIGIFVAGVAAGIVVIVSLGIHQEERDLTLTGRAPDRKSQGARSLTGLYVRQRSDSPAFLTAPVVRAEPAGTTADRQRGAGGLDVRPPAARSGDWPRAAPCQRRPAGDGCPPATETTRFSAMISSTVFPAARQSRITLTGTLVLVSTDCHRGHRPACTPTAATTARS